MNHTIPRSNSFSSEYYKVSTYNVKSRLKMGGAATGRQLFAFSTAVNLLLNIWISVTNAKSSIHEAEKASSKFR